MSDTTTSADHDARKRALLEAFRRFLPAASVLHTEEAPEALRMRRAHRVPAGAPRRGASRDGRAGAGGDARLLASRRAGGRAGGGHGALGRRPAARRRGPAEPREAQPDPGGGYGQPRGAGAAGGAQPRDLRARRAARALLRAGPLLADRVQHRRQRRGERGGTPLPEVRPHRAQRPGAHRDHRGRGAHDHRQRRPRRPRLRSCWR